MNGFIKVVSNIGNNEISYGWQGRELSSAYGGVFQTYGSWCISTGGTAQVYEALNELPTFTGEWSIDEENSNELGKQYLSNVLVDK